MFRNLFINNNKTFIIIFISFLLIQRIKTFAQIDEYKTHEFNYESSLGDDDYDNTDFTNEKEMKEFKFDDELEPMFNLTEILQQPILPGVRNEYWPFINNLTRNECENCECGVPLPNRIVGGSKAYISDFPWMVMLTYQGRFMCGGSLLNNRYVLTAAHCTQGINVRDLECRFAESLANEPFKTRAVFRKVASFVRSRKYNDINMDSDISILKLKTKVTFSNKIRPICLPDQGSTVQNEIAVVTGWGAIYSSGPSSFHLRKVEVPVLTGAQCRKTAYKNKLTKNMLCAGRKGKDACQGDSGGPLVTYDNALNKHVQIGVVSWGIGCGFNNQPGVYTKVSNFIQWIENNSKTKCKCNK